MKHHWKNCREGDPRAKEALQALTNQLKAEKKRATKEKIAQASANVGYASSSARTRLSASGSNEIEDYGNLAMVIAAAPTPYEAAAPAPSEEAAPTTSRKAKKRSATAKKEEGSAATTKKEERKVSCTKKGEKGSTSSTKEGQEKNCSGSKTLHSIKEEKKQSVAASPSTPSKCKVAEVSPDSPVMGTRSKVKKKSLTELLA